MTDHEAPDGPVTALADDLLDVVLDAEPMYGSLLGLPGREDGLADLSAAAAEATARRYDALAARAEATGHDGLGETDRQTVDLVRHLAGALADEARLGSVEWTVTDLWVAPAASLLEMLPRTPVDTATRAAGYLSRLDRIPVALQQAAERHAEGAAAGRTAVAPLVEAAIAHLDRVLGDDLPRLRVTPGPDADPDGTFTADRDRLVADRVVPALQEYRRALADVVLPVARPDTRPGLSYLPDGAALYATAARGHTSTHRDPAELHALGLSLVEALAAEWAEVGSRALGTSDLPEIFRRLRTDDDLAYRDADEMLTQAREVIARAEAAAPSWFGRVPEQQVVVEAVPAESAAGAPPASYLPGALDGSRPGTYFLNTHEPTQRRRYSAEAIAFHEAVPGHHFQLTTAQQLTDLPLLRRVIIDTAFAEGWGLYCERLADEMGLYSGDLARLGMLGADAWRAARLVVDSGLHAHGWTREQARDYLRVNTPLSEIEIGSEVDRYIAYPGQALSYMVGRLELQAMRARTSDRLGATFSLPAFHDLLLGTGGLPLEVLGGVVDRWPG